MGVRIGREICKVGSSPKIPVQLWQRSDGGDLLHCLRYRYNRLVGNHNIPLDEGGSDGRELCPENCWIVLTMHDRNVNNTIRIRIAEFTIETDAAVEDVDMDMDKLSKVEQTQR